MRRYGLHAISVAVVTAASPLPSCSARPPDGARIPAPGEGSSTPLAPGAVRVVNRSEPVLCAEKDNVSILFQAPGVRRFTIEAAHPSYIGMLHADSWDADWTDCDMSGDPAVPAEPKELVLYESAELRLVAFAYPSFWRKSDVPFRVGDRVEAGLHLVQLWVTSGGRRHELLVVYPPDGYFRAHPLPPEHLTWSAYGSSFLVGPVEEAAGRPVVNLREIAFEPAGRRFQLTYRDGSTGTLAVRTADRNRTVLDVELQLAGGGATVERPFAALRSMYVTEYNADVARIAVRDPAARGWEEAPILSFAGGSATDVWAGRLVPSRHNTSAPDMVFRGFQR